MRQVVLLDLDGTMIDSNDAHALSWLDAFREHGFEIDFEKVRPLIGMGSDQLIPKVLNISAESDLAEKMSSRRGEIFRSTYLKSLKPFRDARKLIQKFQSEGIEIVVATSASDEDLEGLLKQIGIDDLIKHATSSDDADKSKPSPDIIIEAMKKVKARPEECVMLGDTPYDIQAAEKAGVKTLGFTCGGWDAPALQGAVDIYEGPWDLLQEFEESILNRPASLKGSSDFNLGI